MAWTTPQTAVAFEPFTADMFNETIRDNLLETAPAKVSAAGQLVVSTGVNTLTGRAPAAHSVAAQESTSSSSFTDLTTVGPRVTLTTGSRALVIISAAFWNTTGSNQAQIGYAITGASSIAATDARCLCWEQDTVEVLAVSNAFLHTDLTPGSNTFTMKYRQAQGGACVAVRRDITVIPF